MAEENNLTANELYFAEVENEQGLELSLEEGLQKNLVALLVDRYDKAIAARDHDEERCIIAYHNYRGQYNKTVTSLHVNLFRFTVEWTFSHMKSPAKLCL